MMDILLFLRAIYYICRVLRVHLFVNYLLLLSSHSIYNNNNYMYVPVSLDLQLHHQNFVPYLMHLVFPGFVP